MLRHTADDLRGDRPAHAALRQGDQQGIDDNRGPMLKWLRRSRPLIQPVEEPAIQTPSLLPYPGAHFGHLLLDAAAWRARWLRDYTWRGQYDAPPALADQFPDATASEISDAEEQAAELVQAAFFSADYGGRGVDYLKRSFPGFSDETYSMVYGYGCSLAR